jgi:plastocyanin
MRGRHIRIQCSLLLFLTCALAPPGVASMVHGQSLLDRTPNLSGGWVGERNVAHFNFLHRFNHSGEPQRQITNRPTFLLALGVAPRLLAGVHYATRSDVVGRMPNEWELFGRFAALDESRHPLDASIQLGWNAAAQSVDAELAAARGVGRLRLSGAARAFSAGYGEDARFAVAAGASLRLSGSIAVAGDIGTLLDAAEDEHVVWGAALQGVIPLTPHSFSVQATNTNSATLQGASRGGGDVRWGFEFTVPITLARYFGRRTPAAQAGPDTGAGAAARAGQAANERAGGGAGVVVRDSVIAGMRNLAYTPERIEIEVGTTVVWRNADPVEHTVTAPDGSWDSGLIEPGSSWRRTFDRPGTYPFFCTPHPFMTGVVVVRAREGENP